VTHPASCSPSVVRIVLRGLLVSAFILSLTSSGSAVTSEDVNSALQRAEDLQGTVSTDNSHSEGMAKEAAKAYTKFKEKRSKEVDAIKKSMQFDGKTITVNRGSAGAGKKEGKQAQHHLETHERIYIFISSSMPKNTLINYARAIDAIKDDRIVMVLRGCVQGCTKIMPTAHFIKGVVNPAEGDELQVEVIIDPSLYGLYKISQVPAIVYAQNVSTINEEGSEGNLDNLNGKPSSFMVLGDVALDYALQSINIKANSPALVNVITTLQKTTWFSPKEQ